MALGYDGVIRIDTLINNDGFTKGLKEMSDSLEKEVKSSEKLLEELQNKREEAANAAQVKKSNLDEERLKLAALQKQLQQLKQIANNVNLPEGAREDAAAQIPNTQMQLEKQRDSISELQQEYEKAAASVEKYDAKIADTAADLEVQRTQAQQAAEELAAAKEDLAGLGRSAEVSSQRVVDLSHTLAELQKKQQTLENAGLGLGFQEYDENVSQIAAITAELKQYQAQLQKVSETDVPGENSEKLLASLQKIGETFSGSEAGLSQLAGGWMDRLDAVKDDLKQAADEARNAWDEMLDRVKKNAAAAGKALAGVIKNSAALVKNILGTVQNILPLIKNMNGFARVAESIQSKLERLGSTLKRALVFSVAYRGISLLRQEMSAYLMVNQQFVSALAQIKGVLLTAFQPVYDAVVPALATLLNMLSSVIAAVSHFTASLFGTTAKQAQKNAESLYQQAHALDAAAGAAHNAAKEADTAVAAFDEFNILSFPDQTGSSGGGGVSAIEMPDFDYEYDETQFDSWGEAFSAFLDKLLAGIPKLEDAFQGFAEWLNGFSKKLLDMFHFPGVLEKVERLGRDLANAFNKLVNWIDWFQLGQALGAGLNLALQFLTEFIYGFDWMNLGSKLASFINGLVLEVDWYDFGRLLWAEFKIALETLAGFLLGLDMPLLAQAASQIVTGFFDEMQNTIQKIQWASIGRQIAEFLNHVDWYGAVTSALAGIAAAVMALKYLVDGFVDGLQWDDIAKRLYSAINSSMGQIDWLGLGQTLGSVFIHAVAFLRDLIAGIDWYQIGADVGNFLIGIDWVGAVAGLAQTVAEGIGAAIRAVRGFLDTISPHIQDIAHGIADKINEFFQSVDWAEAGRVISDGLEAALDFALEFMRTVDWNAIGQCIVTLLENINWAGLLEKWGELVGKAMTAKLAMINLDGFVSIGAHVVEGLLQGMLDKISSISTWLKEHIVDPVVNGVKDLFGIHSPSTVMAEIGVNLIAGLLLGISETWNSIVEFFAEKAEGIKTSLSQTWEEIQTTAKTAFDNIRTAISSIWDNIKSNTSETWQYIKTSLETAWNNLKTTAAAVFNDIKSKIVEAWTNIKNEAVSKWNEITSTISSKISEIKTKAAEGFTNIRDTIVGKIQEAMNNLKNMDWKSIGTGMIDGILSGLNGIFSKLKSWASDVWSSITSAFSSSNARSSVSTSVSSRAATATMAAVPVSYQSVQLPKLANGAVIPPNQQFAAILGDQRSGVNIEAPLSTIKQAVSEAMQELGGFGGDIHITVESLLDGKIVARNTVKHVNDMTRSAGKPVLLF